MRNICFISFALLLGCQSRIDESRARELASYLQTLEYTQERQSEIMGREVELFKMQMDEMGIPDDPSLEALEETFYKSTHFQRFISDWKMAIIENTGGYSMYEDIPEGWYKTIAPVDFKPDAEDTIKIDGEKSVLMALIELTNLSITYSSKLNKQNQELINAKREPNLTALFLAQSIQEPNRKIEGPLLYSFDYYPIDSLEINGKWYYGDEYVEIPREEWDKIRKQDLNINLPLKLYWGDTTFQFSSKKY